MPVQMPRKETRAMRTITLLVIVFVIGSFVLMAQNAPKENKEIAAIKEVLVQAYVKGVYIHRDKTLVEKGFHPEFVMHVWNNDQVIKASLSMWLDRLKLDGQKHDKAIDYRFDFVDVTGTAAVVKMQIHEDARHIYTDYFSLYRFANEWKIVSKIFMDHD